jgi:dTDP-4-amino-4,6-dideoxygalactose transaminase
MIPFNKPYLTGKEMHYIYDAVQSGKISGNGKYTKKCQEFFEKRYSFGKCLLTSSCTDALEMAAILMNIVPGDEVILPSYTFVSTANAFVLRGASLVFCDSRNDHPGIDEDLIETLITTKTKAIVVVHYAGVACDMDKVMRIANNYGLFVVEDAAQAIDSYYYSEDRDMQLPLGSIGQFATFSFHETKNIISGEGGMLVVNDSNFYERAEVIWEKGTNRSAFFKGEVDKYGWVDIGSSFLPSEITAAFLWAQLEHLEIIQNKRILLWEQYNTLLSPLNKEFKKPIIPSYSSNNAHIYYLIVGNELTRDSLIDFLKINNILSVFHYISLERSIFFLKKYSGNKLINSSYYSNCLFRLPMYFELENEQLEYITEKIYEFFNKH